MQQDIGFDLRFQHSHERIALVPHTIVRAVHVLTERLNDHLDVLFHEWAQALKLEDAPEGLLGLGLHFHIVVPQEAAESINQLHELTVLAGLYLHLVALHKAHKRIDVLQPRLPVVCLQCRYYLLELLHHLRVHRFRNTPLLLRVLVSLHAEARPVGLERGLLHRELVGLTELCEVRAALSVLEAI